MIQISHRVRFNMHTALTLLLAGLSFVSHGVWAQTGSAQAKQQPEQEKHHQDPTKIVTKLGVGYSDAASVRASVSLDSTRKINASYQPDSGEWRLGGSWLFDIGIVNFSFSRSDYDEGGYKNDYSVGSYIPLSLFNFSPWGWHAFLQGGYSYKDGERWQPAQTETAQQQQFQISANGEPIITNFDSHSGYIGGFAFKPLSPKWSVMTFAGGSMGSNDYFGYWIGGGGSYQLTKQQSLSAYLVSYGDDYSDDQKLGLSYTYELDAF